MLEQLCSLSDFETVEKAKAEREAALNALEALVYDLGMKIEEGETLYEYTTDEERTAIKAEVCRSANAIFSGGSPSFVA